MRWSQFALWPEIAKPTLHVLNWMAEAEAETDAGRTNDTDAFLVAAGQPTAFEMARQMAAKGTLPP